MSQIIGAVLQAANADDVRPEHLPLLPAWFPADPSPSEDNPHPAPLTDEQRTAARHAAALREARRGPDDGTRGQVVVLQNGPPELLRVHDSGWAYRLQPGESRPDWAVYRYSPADSPQHLSTMLVVAEAYREVGPEYTRAARTDEAQHEGITAERIR